MNPMALGGAGGLSSSSSASGQSGPASAQSGTGVKNISFGGNPNTVGGVLSNPVVLVAIVAGIYLVLKK